MYLNDNVSEPENNGFDLIEPYSDGELFLLSMQEEGDPAFGLEPRQSQTTENVA